MTSEADMTSEAERLSLGDAAERLGVHYMTAYRYVRSGRLVAHKEGGEWRVDPAELAALVTAPPDRPGRTAGAEGTARVDRHRARLEDRLIAGDEAGAWRVVEEYLHGGGEPADVLLQILSPAMVSVGERWAAGRLTIAEEHRATAVGQRLVGRLGPRFARRGRKRGGVVLGAAPGDRHALPSAILADLLRAAGFEVADLGADAPAACFADCALATDRLIAVGVCVTVTDALDGVPPVLEALRTAGVTAPLVVGGSAVRSAAAAHRLGADLHARNGPDVVALIDGLTNPAS